MLMLNEHALQVAQDPVNLFQIHHGVLFLPQACFLQEAQHHRVPPALSGARVEYSAAEAEREGSGVGPRSARSADHALALVFPSLQQKFDHSRCEAQEDANAHHILEGRFKWT
jgi:hypothetical protein